jgi:anti-sigma regulatory factor (Ser/Thr protein kinase)
MVSSSSGDNPALPTSVETLQIINRLSELDVLSHWVADLSVRLSLSARVSFRLDLVLTEAVTNVIENAYTEGIDQEISIVVEHRPPLLEAHIRDHGQPFNPLEYPEMVQPKSLEEARVGGLGIHLIRSYAQECRYQRDGQENRLSIVLATTE